MNKVLHKLKDGDLRSAGRSSEVVKDILKEPALFKDVFEGMLSNDPVIRIRSADVIEKVSARHPEYLQPFKYRLINEISGVFQQEVRWHTARMFSYLEINNKECYEIIKVLLFYIRNEKSSIVKVFSMQTLADLALRNGSIKPQIVMIIEEAMENGSKAVVNRGRKLLEQLEKTGP